MFRVILFAVFIFGAWRWGDWRNWRKYYASILFYIICSLLYSYIHYNYPLWEFNPTPPLHNILFNDSLVTLAIVFVIFPATTLIYLGRYPEGKKQYVYIAAWVALYVIIELIAGWQGGIHYHNGWNIWYSAAFNLILFTALRIHYLKPVYAWCLVLVFSCLIWTRFGLPFSYMK